MYAYFGYLQIFGQFFFKKCDFFLGGLFEMFFSSLPIPIIMFIFVVQ